MITALLFFSCKTNKALVENIPEILPGFTLLPAPNSLDKPGTIIGVDSNGMRLTIARLDLGIETGAIVLPRDSGSVTTTVGIVINFFGTQNGHFTANASGKLNNEINYKIVLDGASEELVPILKLQNQLDSVKPEIKKASDGLGLAGYRYFLIVDAVKAKKISYFLASQKARELGLKAAIDSVINVNPNVKWANNKEHEVRYDLQEPLYVLAKYIELPVLVGASGETKLIIGKPVTGKKPVYSGIRE